MTTTADRLAEIRARAERATEGPWVQLPPWETVPATTPSIISPNGDIADRIEAEADAEFIAHAREDVPYLLDEVERLRADLSRLDESHARQAATLARVRERLAEYDEGGSHPIARSAARYIAAALTEETK